MDRRKAKRNPKGLCKICGDKIINRLRNSLYCLVCLKKIENLYYKLSSKGTKWKNVVGKLKNE